MTDLCSDNQLYILNGRTLGDLTGKFTCHTSRGSSVIDYIIASKSLSNSIFNMFVHDISLFSDHCAVSMKLKICKDNLIDDNILNDGIDENCIPLPDNFVWSEDAKRLYQKVFETEETKSKIADIEKEVDSHHNIHIQSMIDKTTVVMITAGSKTLFRKTFKLKRKYVCKINKKWYDKKVQVGKDQEKAQSEKDSHSKNRGGKKPN